MTYFPPYMQFSVCKCKFVQTKRKTSLGGVLYISLLPLIDELSRAGPIVAGGRVSWLLLCGSAAD